MPGTKNMRVGALWAIGGTLLTFITLVYAIESGGSYVVTYGAIVYGSLQFVKGLFQYIGYHLKGEDGKQQVHEEASLRAILRAMMATAAADGKIEDSEIETIAAVYEQIFGGNLEKEWIKETAEQMVKDDFDIYEAISEEKSIIDPDLIPLVFQASYFVADSDGSIDDSESEILIKIANSLGMSDIEIQNSLSELQQPQSA